MGNVSVESLQSSEYIGIYGPVGYVGPMGGDTGAIGEGGSVRVDTGAVEVGAVGTMGGDNVVLADGADVGTAVGGGEPVGRVVGGGTGAEVEQVGQQVGTGLVG